MEGFVYVMSNRAMPGLVKVGFTTGTPAQRAAQLGGTHFPHPVVVEYSVRVPDARAVERRVHLRLRRHREGKEWFRCSRDTAIAAIQRAAGDAARDEFSLAEKQRQYEKEQEQACRRLEQESLARVEAARKAKLRMEVEARHQPRLQRCFVPFSKIYLWSCVACWVAIACVPNATLLGGLAGGALAALVVAFVAKGVLDDRTLKSPAYQLATYERQRELDAIERPRVAVGHSASLCQPDAQGPAGRSADLTASATPRFRSATGSVIVLCVACGQKLRLPAGKCLDATCPTCRHAFRIDT